ncbi:ParB N-terminal domain-containing protein [Rhizobium rhizosphaerae]|uniref:ParB N-terminal domain-containing protein n=1 Tax=Xaviernesmea rhizosphaerae TaxID=1672749 RepID=UPI00094F8249
MRAISYVLLDSYEVIATEETDPRRLFQVEADVRQSGRWRVPICVHRDEKFVMDGHHRLETAKRLGLRFIPAVLLDYSQVELSSWRDGETVTPADIFNMARSGKLFPCKTTRHSWKNPIPNCDIDLRELGYCISLPANSKASPAGFASSRPDFVTKGLLHDCVLSADAGYPYPDPIGSRRYRASTGRSYRPR